MTPHTSNSADRHLCRPPCARVPAGRDAGSVSARAAARVRHRRQSLAAVAARHPARGGRRPVAVPTGPGSASRSTRTTYGRSRSVTSAEGRRHDPPRDVAGGAAARRPPRCCRRGSACELPTPARAWCTPSTASTSSSTPARRWRSSASRVPASRCRAGGDGAAAAVSRVTGSVRAARSAAGRAERSRDAPHPAARTSRWCSRTRSTSLDPVFTVGNQIIEAISAHDPAYVATSGANVGAVELLDDRRHRAPRRGACTATRTRCRAACASGR